MLKKIILMSCFGLISVATFAQKAKVREATRELNAAIEARGKQDLDKEVTSLKLAKDAINEAITNDRTKDDSKTWLTKAEIYINMNHNETLQSGGNAIEAEKALDKAASLDDKIVRSPQFAQLKFQISVDYYNIAVQAYQKGNYADAYNHFESVSNVLKEEQSNMYKDIPMVDTVRSQSYLLQGYSAFYANKNEEAITIFNTAKNDPIINSDPNIYYVLAEAYAKEGDEKSMLSTIEAGRKVFPDNENLARLELNYYLESGNEEVMVEKLKEAIKQNPTDPELVFNLGIVYAGLAENAKGEQQEAHLKNSEEAYKQALQLDPQDGKFNYQLGAFYFNKAAKINTAMQELDYREQKKYEEMEVTRNATFEEAIPFLEASRGIYQRNSRNLTQNDVVFYKQSLIALSSIYATLNKLDKAESAREELDRL